MRSTFDCRFYILLLFVIFIKCTVQATQTPTGHKIYLQHQEQEQQQQLTLYKPADYLNEINTFVQQATAAAAATPEVAKAAVAVNSDSSAIPPTVLTTTITSLPTSLLSQRSNDQIKHRNESRNRNTLDIKEITKGENDNKISNCSNTKTVEFELKQQHPQQQQQNFTRIDENNKKLNNRDNDVTNCAKQNINDDNNNIKWTNLTHPVIIKIKTTAVSKTTGHYKTKRNYNEQFISKNLNATETTATAKIATTTVLKQPKKSYDFYSSNSTSFTAFSSVSPSPSPSTTSSLSSSVYISSTSASIVTFSNNSPSITETTKSTSPSSMFDILKLKPQSTKYKWWQHYDFNSTETLIGTESERINETETENENENEKSNYTNSSRKIFKDFYKPSQMMPSMSEQKQQKQKQQQQKQYKQQKQKQQQQHKAHSFKQVSPAKKPEHRISVHVAHKIHHKELKTIHREAFKKKQQRLNRDKNESFKHYLNNNNNIHNNHNNNYNNNNNIFLKRGKRIRRDTKLLCDDQQRNQNENQHQNQQQNKSNEIAVQQMNVLDNYTESNILLTYNNEKNKIKNNNNRNNVITVNNYYKQYNYTTIIPPRINEKVKAKVKEQQKETHTRAKAQMQAQVQLQKQESHYLNQSFMGMMKSKRSHSHAHSAIRVPVEVLSKPQESVVIIGDDEEFNSAADRKHEFAAFNVIDYDKNDENSDSRQFDDQPKVMPLRPILQNPYDDEEMSVIYAEQHTEIRLMCEVDLDIATTMWYKNGQVVHAMDRTTRVTDYRFIKEANGALTITNVMLEDDGKWQCEAENIKQYTLNARPVKLVVLDRPKPPYLLIDSRRLDAGNIFVPIKENSELNLACISEGGNPRPTLNWEILLSPGVDRHAQKVSVEDMELEEIKNDKDKNSYKINSGAKSEARLKAVYRAHHNARILCVMEHPTLKIRQNASLLLDVQYTPSFAISRTPGFGYPLREGIEVSLKCDVDSNPPSTPRWQKDDGDPPVPQTGDGFLNFTTIRREHSGWYKCTSKHLNFQYSSIGYYLSVRYDSVDVTSEPDDQDMSVAASSHNSNKGQLEVQLGGAVTLQCPQGSLGCWSHLDPVTARLRGLGHGLSIPTGQFSLKDIVYQDAGTYKCIGQSPVNKKKLEVLETVSVTVKGTPTVVARNATPVAYPGSPLHLAVEFCANPSAHAARWLHGDRVYTPGNQYGSTVLAYAVTDLPIPFCKEARLTYVSMHDRVPRTFYFIVSSPGGVAEATFKVNFTVRYRTVTNMLDDEQEELSEPEEIHFPVFGRTSPLSGTSLTLSTYYKLLTFFFFFISIIHHHFLILL